VTHIPFNRAYLTGREMEYMHDGIRRAHIAGDGEYTARCRMWLNHRTGCHDSLLVHSCTAGLELSAMLLDIGPGDEVILPSYTFVTSANAFVLRGGTPVFVDIRPDTLNVDERKIEAAITPRTKAIVVVHYAGVGCEMDAVMQLAEAHGLRVIEDAAQGICATYRGRPLGTMGAIGTMSFHETKNVTCGEGGALLINDAGLKERAEILREKGTNRSRFRRGQVDKYTWVDIGSSYALSDLAAAFLCAQLEEADRITESRLRTWHQYHAAFADLERRGIVRRPVIPANCTHNAHMYYLLLPSGEQRDAFIARLADEGVNAVFHYVPLHRSPAGRTHGRAAAPLPVTDELSERLVRLPLWMGMSADEIDRVIEVATTAAVDVVRRVPVAAR
jgi:dTDP-4-amino-4,6-dideoxygalactose transaminase